MSNKRRYHRVKVKAPLTFRLPLMKREHEGSTVNISGTGLAFSTKHPIAKGQNLIIKLLLPGDEEATVQANVVWVQKIEGEKKASSWFKVGAKLDENLSYDGKKYLKFYSRELSRSTREGE